MTILLGIIGFHFIVILRALRAPKGKIPYIFVFLVTALLCAFMLVKMFTMELPEP